MPKRDPHRTRTDLAVAEGYLIVAEGEIQTSDKHHFFVYHIFHIAAWPAALVETGEGAAALSRFVDYFLRYLVCHRLFNTTGFSPALGLLTTDYPYYRGAMQSNCFRALVYF